MKIRNGFVSNSSSSSFIVAIPDDVKTEDKALLDLFTSVLDETGLFNHPDTFLELPEDIINKTKKTIDEVEKDIYFLEDYIDELNDFLNEENSAIIDKYFEILSDQGMTTDTWQLRSARDRKNNNQKWRSFKGQGVEPYQRRLTDYKKKLEDMKKELELYEQVEDGYDYIAKFKIDNWASTMEKRLQALIDYGVVKLLSKEYN